MKRILALALTFALALTPLAGSPVFAAGAAAPRAAQQNGSIAGIATSQTGDLLPNVTVQLRDLATGQIVGTQTTTQAGGYLFSNLPAGNYAVEALNPAGQVIGTSASITLSAGQTVTGIVLQASAALLTGAAAAAAGAGGVGAGVSTAVLIAIAAGTAYIGAQTTLSGSASPSR